MFTIISIMFVGIGIGYVLRNLQFFQKITIKKAKDDRIEKCN